MIDAAGVLLVIAGLLIVVAMRPAARGAAAAAAVGAAGGRRSCNRRIAACAARSGLYRLKPFFVEFVRRSADHVRHLHLRVPAIAGVRSRLCHRRTAHPRRRGADPAARGHRHHHRDGRDRLSLWPLAGVPLVVCLLLGAVVATTDPAAVIAIFRDVGAPARLTRLVEGEALLNDAAAISLFVVLLGMILSGRQADIAGGFTEFVLSFAGGGIFGICIGRLLVFFMSQVGDDRLAEASLTLAFAYVAFIAAERLLHVSGVVSVLGCGLMVSAFGRARIAPSNWTFLSELWEQVAFWARSLIFLLAAILVPRLLVDVTPHDAVLLVVLIAAAFAARILSLFGLVPMLEWLGLSQPIDRAYKLAIIWGGLRGALTLVLALAVTENAALDPGIRRFVAILATGFVLFTLFVNGTTLRWVIGVLGLDRLSLRDQALRDRVLALSYAEIGEQVRAMAKEPALDKEMIARVAAPYEARTAAGAAAEPQLPERDRLAVALAALGNQERVLVLDILAGRAASPAVAQVLLDQADALVESARAHGRLGYRRAADATLAFGPTFRAAYYVYRRFGAVRLLSDRLAERVEMLLILRDVLDQLVRFNDQQIRKIFGERISAITHKIIGQRRMAAGSALDALRRQYPDYTSGLETLLVRRSAMRQELIRYRALNEEGLITREVYDHLQRTVELREAPSGDRGSISASTPIA